MKDIKLLKEDIILEGIVESHIHYKVYLRAKIKDGILVFTPRGDIYLQVDTGFEGSIILPSDLLNRLDTVQSGRSAKVKFVIGPAKEYFIFSGKIKINKLSVPEIEAEFIEIPGAEPLIGMEFLTLISSHLVFDFRKKVNKLFVVWDSQK